MNNKQSKADICEMLINVGRDKLIREIKNITQKCNVEKWIEFNPMPVVLSLGIGIFDTFFAINNEYATCERSNQYASKNYKTKPYLIEFSEIETAMLIIILNQLEDKNFKFTSGKILEKKYKLKIRKILKDNEEN